MGHYIGNNIIALGYIGETLIYFNQQMGNTEGRFTVRGENP